MKFILKIFILLPVVLLFWLLMALAADGYLEQLANSRGRYADFNFSDYIPFYSVLSLFVLSLLYGLQFGMKSLKITYVTLLALFGIYLSIVISDDLKAGRPIIPEILFVGVMVVFHALLLKGLMWLTSQSQATQ